MSQSDPIQEFKDAQNAIIQSFDYVWQKSRIHLEDLIRRSENLLSQESYGYVNSAFETLRDGVVATIMLENNKNHKTLSSLQKNEVFIFQGITSGLSDVFKELLQAYLKDTGYANGSENISQLSIKLNNFNMDTRYPSRSVGPGNAWSPTKTEELRRTYQGIVDVIRLTRNFASHLKDQEMKDYFKLVKRKVSEPVINAESPGGFFVIISLVTMVIHEFIDILQIWLDSKEIAP